MNWESAPIWTMGELKNLLAGLDDTKDFPQPLQLGVTDDKMWIRKHPDGITEENSGQ